MGGQRSLRMAEQRQQVLGRRGAQTEKLDESMVGDAAARFYGESGIPVRNIAYGFDPGLPHGGIGGFDGLYSLFGGEALPHLRHGTGKPRKTTPFGDRPQQIGEFEVAVGIDQPRSEHPGIELGAGTPVGLGTRPDGEDTAVGRNPDQGIAEQTLRCPEQVRGYPPGWLRGGIHRQRFAGQVVAGKGCRRQRTSWECSRFRGRSPSPRDAGASRGNPGNPGAGAGG